MSGNSAITDTTGTATFSTLNFKGFRGEVYELMFNATAVVNQVSLAPYRVNITIQPCALSRNNSQAHTTGAFAFIDCECKAGQ